MKKQVIKDTLALLVITIVSALCLSLVYSLTSAKIADAEAKEKTDSFYAVSEKAASFDKIDASVIDGFNKENSGAAVLEAYEAKDGEGAVCGRLRPARETLRGARARGDRQTSVCQSGEQAVARPRHAAPSGLAVAPFGCRDAALLLHK